MIIGEGRWGKGKRYHKNCLTFDRIIPHDNRVIQMFKWLHQKWDIFARISARNNRSISNYQVIS